MKHKQQMSKMIFYLHEILNTMIQDNEWVFGTETKYNALSVKIWENTECFTVGTLGRQLCNGGDDPIFLPLKATHFGKICLVHCPTK